MNAPKPHQIAPDASGHPEPRQLVQLAHAQHEPARSGGRTVKGYRPRVPDAQMKVYNIALDPQDVACVVRIMSKLGPCATAVAAFRHAVREAGRA